MIEIVSYCVSLTCLQAHAMGVPCTVETVGKTNVGFVLLYTILASQSMLTGRL